MSEPLPPGRARLVAKPPPIGSETLTKTIGIVLFSDAECSDSGSGFNNDHVGLILDHRFCQSLSVDIPGHPAIVEPTPSPRKDDPGLPATAAAR
jgi:hypothetical protein